MYPELLHLGPVTVYSWGFMLSLAVLVGVLGARRLAKRVGIDPDRIVDFALLVVVAGLVGARLVHVLFVEWDYYFAHPLDILNPYHQGLVFQGALLLGILAAFGFVRYFHLSFWNFSDVIAPFVALGYSVVRIGCFLAGCCYGRPTDLPWGVVFPALLDVPRHPTQLYSSLFGILLFFFLWWLFPRRTFPGQVFLSYLIVYSLGRILIENWRDNPLFLGPFTLAQVAGGAVFVIAAILYLRLRSRGPVGGE
ncbi:MAG: prolipoprotein diacylglyceryl transferase [Syntrophomonadaceae bacterium]|nr:prolipoprotein diacylglyceryl transferase [Syntrophomonadaceae bacterium]